MPILLTLTLALAPPTYEQALAELDAAEEAVVEDTSDLTDSTELLEQAIEQLTRYPSQLPTDAAARDRLARARLALVWRYANEHDERAEPAMDEAIRAAQGRALPAGRFGPEVLRLYEDRRDALRSAGTGIIEVDCGARPCQLIVDEQRSANPTDPLYLGTYRVYVGDPDAGAQWEFFEVELDEAGETERLVHTTELEPAASEATEPVPPDESNTRTHERRPRGPRLLPRWASLVGAALGAGLAVGGGLMLLDGACLNGAEPTDAAACPKVWNLGVPVGLAYALLGTGVAAVATSGVILTFDEVRVQGSAGRQAMLHWRLRF